MKTRDFLGAAAVCVMMSVMVSGCDTRPLYKDKVLLLGTFVEVASPRKDAAEIVFTEMRRIEHLLSKYDPQSQVSILNKNGRIAGSQELFYLVNRSRQFWIDSGGMFDITVGALLDLWGFTDKRYRVPGEGEVQKALETVGMDKIILDEAQYSIEFIRPGVKIDLGGIAKGYAVDCAVAALKKAGITSCLIRAGGQIYCMGDAYGRPWKIAIQDPSGGPAKDMLPALRNKAVATSGIYEQNFSADQKQYGHILNPHTGYPAEASLASVTVVADDGLTADALSTCLFILGRTKGEVMLQRYPGVQWFMIDKPQ